MPTINPSQAQLQGLSSMVPDGQAIVMINLLRFREKADYPPGSQHQNETGRQAYDRYSQHALQYLATVGGRPIWRGQAKYAVIAPELERWDEVILVQYPSRSAFERMITNPGYQAGLYLRTAALEDSRLIATLAPQRVGRLGWWLYKLLKRPK